MQWRLFHEERLTSLNKVDECKTATELLCILVDKPHDQGFNKFRL